MTFRALALRQSKANKRYIQVNIHLESRALIGTSISGLKFTGLQPSSDIIKGFLFCLPLFSCLVYTKTIIYHNSLTIVVKCTKEYKFD